MHVQLYKLPDGTITEDTAIYGKAWKDLYSKVESFFPGYRCSGYDPDIHMEPVKPNYWRNESFSLPVTAALTLINCEFPK